MWRQLRSGDEAEWAPLVYVCACICVFRRKLAYHGQKFKKGFQQDSEAVKNKQVGHYGPRLMLQLYFKYCCHVNAHKANKTDIHYFTIALALFLQQAVHTRVRRNRL